MSAAAGAPPPPDPPCGGGGGGPSRDRPDESEPPKPWPNDKAHNGHNNWAKNTTVKTCKCKLCDQRVKDYSWKCSFCSRHLCKECAETNGASRPKDKHLAANYLTNVDGCFYPSGQPPYMHAELEALGLLSLPQKRSEVILRDMRIKAEIKRKKLEANNSVNGKVEDDSEGGKSKKQRTNVQNDNDSPTPGPSRPRNSNGTYKAIVTAEPTIASSKAPRKSAVRKSYGESSSDERSPEQRTADQPRHHNKSASTPKKAAKKPTAPTSDASSALQAQLPCAHLDRGGTVIIGAGIIGLCIARELAMKAAHTNTRHKITVLEIRDGPGELASANCSGLLSIHDMPKPMNELSELTIECWTALFQTPGFMEATDLRQDCVYQVARLNGKGKKHKPSWYTGHDLDSFRDDQWTVGKLDTQKLCSWLYEQCLEYGVNFVFHHEISAVFSAPDKDVSSIAIRDGHDREKARETIRCQNIVFAAGPWSTELFQHMYRNSPLQLENHVRVAYWYRLQTPSMSDKEDVGLLFPDLADADEALEDKITMVGQSQKHSVIVTGVGSKSQVTQLNAVEALDPQLSDAQPLRHLKRIAAKRLDGNGQDVFRADNVARGFSFISTSDQQLPVIDKVPSSGLGMVCTGEEDRRRCGIWLCFGFGMYGTTLAPGVARALCRKIFGGRSGVNDVNFKIPMYAQPTIEQADQ
ncbi:hypothetical protein LTR36_006351 [Oleoguttula mirabilis]|uniref:FAD-dependent oxidoreductase domain-containing protein 1 n=1 Tax=Oleoguttula mirabilis TaxID=1507867 RepID=A0AAV9JUU4_9PEZI|nr:hypothetical protein LTR36_006351 [Oleoguttula mirabilis]